MSKTIAKVAAVLAGLGLILSGFALSVGAQTTTTTTTSSTSSQFTIAFTRDLTIGSTGADVTALQTWLISKGFSIPAGATGYFGTQTQAAVAAYQTANGITPTAGYFGPITRAKVNALGTFISAQPPTPDNDEDEEDEDEDQDEDSDDDSDENEDADSDADNVSTSATVTHTSGADSDSATFEIDFELEAFNQDAYIARDPSVSFEYEIEDGDGNTVGAWTSLGENLDSSADQSGSYYVIEENNEEDFTLTVVFDPLAADEGKFYRLQLLEVHFNDSAAAPDQDWNASPASRYRTDYVYIAD